MADNDHPLATLIRAVHGSEADLRHLVGDAAFRDQIDRHRIGPLLATAADSSGIDGPEVPHWRDAARASAVRHLTLSHTAELVGARLDEASVPWALIKGLAVARTVFAEPAHRPTSDLDLLVPDSRFDDARAALHSAGWRAVVDSPHQESYLRDEGYAWQTVGSSPGILELHFRLWGAVPKSFTEALWRRARPRAERGTEHLLDVVDQYLVGAVHLWTTAPTRPLVSVIELHRLAAAGGRDVAAEIVTRAEAADLQLFVALAATACRELIGGDADSEIAAAIERSLSRPERRVLRWAETHDPLSPALSRIVLARLLSGRDSRAGWRSVWRRAWPHPATVERETAPGRPWAIRRIAHLAGARLR